MDKPSAGPGAPLRKEVAGNTEHQRGKRQVGHQITVVPLEYLRDPSTDWNSELLGKKEGVTYVTRDAEGRLRLATATGPERDDPWTLSLEEAPLDGQRYERVAGQWVPDRYTIATASITHPDQDYTVAVTGTNSRELIPPTGYELALNGYDPQVVRGPALIPLEDGRFETVFDGVYRIDAYADVSHSANSAHIGAVFEFEDAQGGTVVSPRAVHARVPNVGDIGNISGNGVAVLAAGTKIGIAFASDVTGNVNIRTSTMIVTYEGAL